MPYAAENTVSMDPIKGGVQITDDQYRQAISGMMEGKIVSIESGFMLVDPPPPPKPPEPPPENSDRPPEPEQPPAPSADVLARLQRDRLLALTDWTLLRAMETGNPVPTAWSEYRQALRDVPEQAGFPADIQWPTPPA